MPLLPLVAIAPCPALEIEPASVPVVHARNAAAEAWVVELGEPERDWNELAARILVAHAAGQDRGVSAALALTWHAVRTEGRIVAWLAPLDGRATDSDADADPGADLPVAEAVELMGLSVWRVDPAEQRIYQNASGFRLAGVRDVPASGAGMSLAEVRAAVHPDDVPKLERATAQAMLRGAGSVDARARHLQADGRYRTVLSRRIAERDEHGAAVRLIGVSLDITEQAVLEERELEAHRKIEEAHRVADEARREKAMAAQSVRAKSEALATVSHELRTPLSAILGLARRIVRTAAPDAPLLGDVARIEQSANGMLRLVNDILDFAKAESGKLELSHARFILADVLAQARDMVAPQASEKLIGLHVVVDEQPRAVYVGDALRLEQVLVNLLSNAVKFTETGSVTLVVGARRLSAGTDALSFAVHDTGMGIRPDQCDRIFLPFEQADTEVVPATRRGGTGLGLAISQRLVQAMGGVIEVRSVWAQGSTFSFQVPVDAEESASGPGDPMPGAVSTQATLAGVKVLLVDDNDLNQEIAAELLAIAGAQVQVAGDGLEALEAIARAEFDVVLMDCLMPRMDGYAATAELRRDDRYGRLPVVGLSATARPEDRERALASGMDDFLLKPFDPADLLMAVARWSGGTRPATDRAVAPGAM